MEQNGNGNGMVKIDDRVHPPLAQYNGVRRCSTRSTPLLGGLLF